jgi:lipopolysaccharide biosynthesis protein
MSSLLRPIAIHLPQYHPVAENDEWWGKGFTEWTNVTKARPLFKGHYQPHLPADLGFYDLRLAEARAAQAEMAKQYGIYGFCYYHYWFNGRRILEKPAEEILRTGEPDFPFMFCWANENWTRRWDGGDKVVLLKQEYSAADDRNHLQALLPYFNDERYIKIDGKPVFAIYKSFLFPDIKQTTDTLRSEAAKHGLDLYLLKFEHHQLDDHRCSEEGFDASVEFQPWSKMFSRFVKEFIQPQRAKQLSYRARYHYHKLRNQHHKLKQLKTIDYWKFDYNDYVSFVTEHYTYPETYLRYPGVLPGWDNTARRGKQASLFYNSNPQRFAEWLSYHYQNFKAPNQQENFIFINAWNEWAEGNHLEPCRKWGRAYLEALQSVTGQFLV